MRPAGEENFAPAFLAHNTRQRSALARNETGAPTAYRFAPAGHTTTLVHRRMFCKLCSAARRLAKSPNRFGSWEIDAAGGKRPQSFVRSTVESKAGDYAVTACCNSGCCSLIVAPPAATRPFPQRCADPAYPPRLSQHTSGLVRRSADVRAPGCEYLRFYRYKSGSVSLSLAKYIDAQALALQG